MDIKNGNNRKLLVITAINSILLVAILALVILLWQPWSPAINANTRKITVTGSATVEATPDQYQFSPSWTEDTVPDITKLNDQIVTKLKELGVKDSQIKNNASTYGSPELYYIAPVEGKQKTTLSITVTIKDKGLAQKVQDYLLTTNPSGSIAPYPSFSSTKQKELQNKLRSDATADAKDKAAQTAKNLGSKIGKVVEVSESSSGGFYPLPIAVSDANTGMSSAKNSLSLQPGSDEYTYSVTAVFTLD